MPLMDDALEFTVKLKLNKVPLLVRVAVRPPAKAVLAMLMFATTWVVLLTVMLLTVIFGPKLAVVTPTGFPFGVLAMKLVNVPVMVTFRFVWPCVPAVGLML